VEIAVTGGTAPHSFTLDGAPTTNPVTGLAARDNPYAITVADARGCVAELRPRIIYPLEVELAVVDSIDCRDGDGILRATATGGVGTNYFHRWYRLDADLNPVEEIASGESATLAGAVAGKYRVRVADAENNVRESNVVELLQPDSLTAEYSVALPSAHDASDGRIAVVASGGTAPYGYTLDDRRVANPIVGVPARDEPYRVSVADAKGCVETLHPRIVYPLSVRISTLDSISCRFGADGALAATATGGVGTVRSYAWYKIEYGEKVRLAERGDVLSGLEAGTYYVEATDAENNAARSENVEVTQPDLLKIDCSVTLTSAPDASDGAIEVAVSGGTPEYAYLWNYNGHTGSSLAGLPAGAAFYSLTVTDSRGCTASLSTRLVYPMKAGISVLDSISCRGASDGRLRAEAAGGVCSAYEYRWYRLDRNVEIPLAETVELANVGAGNYRVRAYCFDPASARYLTASADVTFNSPDLLTVTPVITLPSAWNASDGGVSLNVAGGTPPYSFVWAHDGSAGSRLENIPANYVPYSVTASDSRGCSRTLAPRIIYPLEVKILVGNSISCRGSGDGQLAAIATGGVGANHSWQWFAVENGTEKPLSGERANTLSNIVAGTYRVKVADAENNEASAILTLGQPDSLRVYTDYVKGTLSCKFDADGAVALRASGGTSPYSWSWTDGTTEALNSSLTEGVHGYAATDARGCRRSGEAHVASPDELTVEISYVQPKAFNSADASVGVAASGGTPPYKYAWEGRTETAASISGVTRGTYTVAVSDANGCGKTISSTVTAPPPLEVSVSETRPVSCRGRGDGALAVDSRGGVGGHEYVWYRVEDGNLRRLASTKDIEGLSAGAYRVAATDENGITAYSADYRLVEPAALKVALKTGGAVCADDESSWMEATASGGTAPYAYMWTSGDRATRVENIAADKYMVFVTDARACEVKGVAEIRTAPKITVETRVTQPVCAADGSAILNVRGGIAPYSFAWKDGSTAQNRNGLAGGDYGVTVTGANGCSANIDFRLDAPTPNAIDLGDDLTLCRGQRIELNATGTDVNSAYKWFRDGLLFAETSTISVSEAGIYRVETADSRGCASEGDIGVSVVAGDIEADFVVATVSVRKEITRFVNISHPSPDSVEWIVPDTPDVATVDKTDEYLDVIFGETGSFTIGMTSFSGDCRKTVYKRVEVLNRRDVPEYVEENVPATKFMAYPNPSNGRFTAIVELEKRANIRLRLVSLSGKVVDDREFKDGDSYEVQYDAVNEYGVYVLQLIADGRSASLTLLLGD
jgi:hypothetical protein